MSFSLLSSRRNKWITKWEQKEILKDSGCLLCRKFPNDVLFFFYFLIKDLNTREESPRAGERESRSIRKEIFFS